MHCMPGRECHIDAKSIKLDGKMVAGLPGNVPVVLNDRDVELCAELDDGSLLIVDLDSTFNSDDDYFPHDMLLTVTITLVPGDINQDGVVDLLDVCSFRCSTKGRKVSS